MSREYDRTVDRPSLFKRWRGMLKLADTRDERALATLSKRYERPEDPSEAVAHLIVHICATRFSEAKFAGAFDAWTRRNAQAKDAWLWYQNARIQASAASSDALVADVKNPKLNVFLRAATLEALASRADDSLLSLIPAVLNELPAKGAERAVMLESCAAALLSHSAELGKDEFKPVAERVIRELDDKKNDERSKLVIARLLKILFKTDTVALESGPWLDLLNNIQPKAPTKPSRYAEKKPQFLGIESTGRRVAYVIDLSDSMLIPLTQKEKEDLKKPLTRGPGEKKDPEGNPPKKEEPKDSKFPGEKDLPWDKINNRFEAAREFLKLSLRALDKDMSFVIIGFGHEAEILTGKGIVPASKQNIETAIKILDEIKAGPSDTNRPHGTLKGFTNLHGGMLRAFRAVTGSLVRGAGGGARERLESIELSPDGRYLMAGAGAKLYCWDLLGQRTVPSVVPTRPNSLCLFQGNRLLAESALDGRAFRGGEQVVAGAVRPFFETGSTRFRVSLGDRLLQFDAAAPGPAREAVLTSGPNLPDLDRETLDAIETAIARSRPGGTSAPRRSEWLPSALGPDGTTLACFARHIGEREVRPEPHLPARSEPYEISQIVLFDLKLRETRGVLDQPMGFTGGLVFSPNGQLLAAHTRFGGLLVYHVATATLRWSLEPRFVPVFLDYLAFTPDSAHLVARQGRQGAVVDSASGRVKWSWPAPVAAAPAAEVDTAGRPNYYHDELAVTLGQSVDRVAIRTADDLIAVHRLADGAPIASFALPPHTDAATFSPDLRWLALLRFDGRVAFLPVDGPAPAEPPWPNGRVISFLDTAANLQGACGLAWSPDGDWLVAVALGQLVVWDARQQRPVRKVVNGIMVPIDPAPEPDGGLACRLDGREVNLSSRAGG
ncbi:MAG: hypothetical protein HUU03_10480, partial [Planctomycetaceae bacterium]|nr:hypothetical protein [Planctomycetaceae bacterium]